jgi:hypothetical protein
MLTEGKVRDALPYTAERLRSDPTNPQYLYEAGVTAMAAGNRALAVGLLRVACQVAPGNALYWYNLGSVTLPLGNVTEAAEAWSHAVRLAPKSVTALVALAGVHRQLGDLVGYGVLADAALAAGKGQHDRESRYALSFVRMLRGDWSRGLADFDERHELAWFKTQQGRETLGLQTPRVRWQGKPGKPGEALLIHTEQGLGDAVMGVRWVLPAVAQWRRGNPDGRVVLECHHQLTRLFEANAVSWGVEVVSRKHQGTPELPEGLTHYCPMFTLPVVLGLGDDVFSEQPRFLAPAKPLLPKAPGLTVGLAWAGSKDHTNDFDRSCPWEAFSAVLGVPGVRYVSLMVDDVRCADFQGQQDVYDIRPYARDVADTAALMSQCDLVIAVDSAGAHLSASLGVETWMLTPTAPEWRWPLVGSETPWYPAMRLYRRNHYKQWAACIAEVKADLIERVNG